MRRDSDQKNCSNCSFLPYVLPSCGLPCDKASAIEATSGLFTFLRIANIIFSLHMGDKVVIAVESKHYEVSKKKLSERSGYFNSMFNGDFLEKNESTINLKGISSNSWERILHYLEHGKMRVDAYSETLYRDYLDLLEAAAMLQFSDIQDRCMRTLFDSVDAKNALHILEVSSKLDLGVLIQKARAIALWNCDVVTNCDSFFDLSPDQIEGYLSDPALHSTLGEWGVWEAVVRWINSPPDFNSPRTEYLPKLIKCVNLNGLNSSDLRTISLNDSVRSSPVVASALNILVNEKSAEKGNEVCATNTSDEIEFNLPKISKDLEKEDVEAKEFLSSWRSMPQRKLPLVPAVVAKVNKGPDVVSPYVVRFSEEEKKLIPLVRLDEVEPTLGALVGFKVIADGSKLYMLGGEIMTRQSSWYHAVWEYDQILGRWLFLANLMKEGRHLSACVFGNDLYVLGGFGRHRLIQDSVCKLSITDKIWTTCAPLPQPMYSVPCCVFKGKIYVIQTKVYQYSPESDSWTVLDIFIPGGVFCDAMTNNDHIFLSGRSRSVYKFNPTVPMEKLEEVGKFKYECSQACLIGDYIYSISQDEFGEELYCEKIHITTGETSLLWEGVAGDEIASLSPNQHHGCFPLLLY